MSKDTELALKEEEAKQLATIEAEMAASVKAMQEGLVVTSSRISNSGKKFTLPDGTVLGSSMKAVILGYVDASAYYPGQWDPNNYSPPVCWAVGMPGTALKPSKKVEKPEAGACADCANDAFGSAQVGDGKACKNEYRVAVVVPGFVEMPVTLAISAKGRNAFNQSLSGVMKNFGHPAQAIVDVEFMDEAYPVVKITGGAPNPDFAKHFAMSKDAVEVLLEA